MQLDKSTDYTPICLPTVGRLSKLLGYLVIDSKTHFLAYNETTREEVGVIVGLGKESSNAWRLPCTVKEANVLTWNDTVCKRMLESMGEDSSKFTSAFCAGYLDGATDSCQGDSGGPLQTINPQTERYELIGEIAFAIASLKYVCVTIQLIVITGLTSFGFGCAAKGVLGVYTDVSHYINWIDGKILEDQLALEVAKKQGNNTYPIENNNSGWTTTSAPKVVHKKRNHRRRPSWAEILNW